MGGTARRRLLPSRSRPTLDASRSTPTVLVTCAKCIDERPRPNGDIRPDASEFDRLRSREDRLGVQRLERQDDHAIRINRSRRALSIIAFATCVTTDPLPAHSRRAVSPVDIGSLGADEELDGLGIGERGDQLEFAAGGPDERAER